jgi:hypothetical protein
MCLDFGQLSSACSNAVERPDWDWDPRFRYRLLQAYPFDILESGSFRYRGVGPITSLRDQTGLRARRHAGGVGA